MTRMIYATKDRDEAHRFLADVLDGPGKTTTEKTSKEFDSSLEAVDAERGSGVLRGAECREDPNAELPYQVWSRAAEYAQRPPTDVRSDPLDGLSGDDVDQLKKLLATIKAGG